MIIPTFDNNFNINKSEKQKFQKSSSIPKSLAQLLSDRRPSYSVSLPIEGRKISKECRKKVDIDEYGRIDGINNKNEIMFPLPSLKDSNNSQLLLILHQKIKQCQQFVDCGEEEGNNNNNLKKVKTNALEEVIEWLTNSKNNKFDEIEYANLRHGLVNIIRFNLFRVFSPNSIQDIQTIEELADVGLTSNLTSKAYLEPNWPHLQLVYRLFNLIIEKWSDNIYFIEKEFNSKFVGELIELFNSEDPRERLQLKNVVYTLYSNAVVLRPEIRKRMGWLLLEHIYENKMCKGVSEILEILGDIINGFNVPLKPEHRNFFLKILLPLHKPKTYFLYFAQLSNCVALFLEKDSTLVKPTFDFILGNWPKDFSSKEVLLITELEELLCRIDNNEFKLICIPLFRQLTNCAKSLHFRVAERALQLWNSETILSFISPNYSDLLFPIMLPALYSVNEGNHWKDDINVLVYKSLMRLKKINPSLFNLLTCNYNENTSHRNKK